MFARGSRYDRVGQALHTDREGRQIPYVLLRTIPAPGPVRGLHDLAAHERLDLVAGSMFGDPQQFWRLCDANRTLRPDDLEVVGTRIVVPLVVG
jgi:hypothetical protein